MTRDRQWEDLMAGGPWPLLLAGAGFWLWGIADVLTGRTLIRGGSVDRDDSPVTFWLAVAFKLLLGGGLLAAALLKFFPGLQALFQGA